MNTEKQGIVSGSFIHDIGKFMQRAELEKEYSEIKDNYNDFCPTPYSYLHAAHSAFFVEKFLPETLVSKEMKKYLYDACRHHLDACDKIFKIADRLSSGMDRTGSAEDGGNYKSTRLVSIFDSVEVLYKNDVKPSWYYDLRKLAGDKELFPVRNEERNLVQEYQQLWTDFEQELNNLGKVQISNFHVLFNELFYLLQKYTWCIPSATNKLPDISLFDHLKTTSAIAACLYDVQQHGESDKGKEFLLFGLDLSGIQSFIFRITSALGIGGISRRLRGRSFYLIMLGEILARYAVNQLDLTIANINFCGGGNIELLLANTGKTDEFLKQFESDVNKWLLDKFSGQIAVAMDGLAISKSDLQNNFHEKKRELQEMIDLKKKRKFETHFGFDSFLHKTPSSSLITVCPSCNLTQIKKGKVICDDCKEHKTIGEYLPETNALVFISGSHVKQPANILESISFGKFGKIYLLSKPDTDILNTDETGYIEQVAGDLKETSVRGFYNFSNVLPVAEKNMTLETEKGEEDEQGKIRKGQTFSFNTIADMATGDKKLGILKMDVDNLGLTFSLGLKDSGISRIATLSRQLSYFFTHIVVNSCNEIEKEWKEGKNKSDWGERVGYDNDAVSNIFYIVFSGGDDLFIVGPWDRIIDLAVLIRKKFKDFTCHNPNLTISAGIFTCKAKYPIPLAAQSAEESLEKSKKSSKNRITVFGETTVWDYEDKSNNRIANMDLFEKYEICREEIFRKDLNKWEPEEYIFPFSRLSDFHKKLLEFDKDDMMPRSFVYRLLEGKKKYFPVEYNFEKSQYEETHDLMIYPYLFYFMNRNLKEEARKAIKSDTIRLIRQIRIPAIMFLMKTRQK